MGRPREDDRKWIIWANILSDIDQNEVSSDLSAVFAITDIS